MEAEREKTVILRCFTEPQTDVRQMTVEWVFVDEKIQDVHLYHRQTDDLEEQAENYKGRTSLSRKDLSSGNCSLSLRVETSLAGTYMCSVRDGNEPNSCSLKLTGKYTEDMSLTMQVQSTEHFKCNKQSTVTVISQH